MTVSAIVVSHGHARELEQSLPALAPQVDELVVIANLPGSVGALLRAPRVLENARPRHVRGEREPRRRGDLRRVRLVSNPDAVPGAGRRRSARRASPTRTRAPASSARSCSGRTAPGSRRSAASRPCWARSGAERRFGCCVVPTPPGVPLRHAPGRAGAGRLAARRRLPADAPLDAGGDRRLGRRLSPLRRGHRRRLPRRAGRLGALARPGSDRPPRVRRGDRQTVPQPAHALASAGNGPVRAQASRAAAGAAASRSPERDELEARPGRRARARRADRVELPPGRKSASTVTSTC